MHRLDPELQAFRDGLGSAIEDFDRKHNSSTTSSEPKPYPAEGHTKYRDKRSATSTSDLTVKRKENKKQPINAVYLVKLSVRKSPLAPNELFEYYSPKLSKLESEIDAQNAARKEGYPIFGHLYDIIQL